MTDTEKNPAKKDLQISWHALSQDEVIDKLQTPLPSGLSTEEVTRRQAEHGLNQLAEAPRPGFFAKLFDQLKGFVVILLIVASIISAVLGDYIEASAIMAIVVLNAILGVVQESRAEQALAALKKLAAPEAQVLRDGKRVSVPAPQLVPGDVVFLEAGNYIPADIRLVEAVNSEGGRGGTHRGIFGGPKECCSLPGAGYSTGGPEKHSLHGHPGLLWPWKGGGCQHGDAYPVGADRHHAPIGRQGGDPTAAAVGRAWENCWGWLPDHLRDGICRRCVRHMATPEIWIRLWSRSAWRLLLYPKGCRRS